RRCCAPASARWRRRRSTRSTWATCRSTSRPGRAPGSPSSWWREDRPHGRSWKRRGSRFFPAWPSFPDGYSGRGPPGLRGRCRSIVPTRRKDALSVHHPGGYKGSGWTLDQGGNRMRRRILFGLVLVVLVAVVSLGSLAALANDSYYATPHADK